MFQNFKNNKHLVILLVVTSILFSCVSKKEEPKDTELGDTVTTKIKIDTTINEKVSSANTEKVMNDFCNDCDALDTWIGGIQGVDVKETINVFAFGECHTNLSYDLVWVPKGDILKFNEEMGHDRLLVYYEEESFKNKYSNLDCFSFVVAKEKRKSTAQDNSKFTYVFPSNVKVYKKTNKVWAHIGTKNIKSFEELGRLKLDAILGTVF